MSLPVSAEFKEGALSLAGEGVLSGLNADWSLVSAEVASGAFLRVTPAEPQCYLEVPAGRIADLKRFTSCHRFKPFWLQPASGRGEAEVKPETLWILAETESGNYTLIVPLLDGPNRYSLTGSDAGLVLVIETGDPALVVTPGTALFVATGKDPYALLTDSAGAVAKHFGGRRLRIEKPIPDFVNLFGWCTWDAFYKDVTEEKVLAGLEVFSAGGIRPPLLILDDGWQSYERFPAGEERLVSLAPNAHFNGDLSPLVRASKERYGVRSFFVWHAFMGYWGGVDPQALPRYHSRTMPRNFGPNILRQGWTWNVFPWGALVSVPAADRIGEFYEDYHSSLAAQGVDGVKVDVQGMLEAVASGQGGRVTLHRAYRQALDGSVNRHFSGGLINCMSCTSECAYLADTAVLRSSDDFYPQQPESHGMHLHVNAQVSLWFGEFMLPDWDMFQSTHERGAFHAASRAISGGPVYVSDKADAHDFALLHKLVLSDGTILRADGPGRPTLDCLFADPTRDDVLLKIFNRNRDCGVVGLFNVRHQPGVTVTSITGEVSPSDIPGVEGEHFIGYAHQAGLLWTAGRATRTSFTLSEGGWELVSYAPVVRGFAVIGLADKLNSTGAVSGCEWHGDKAVTVRLRDGGRLVAWSRCKPAGITDASGSPVNYDYDQASGRISCEIPVGGIRALTFFWN